MKTILITAIILATFSFASAQDMKGMDMSKKEIKAQPQPVTYTCVMHPEIHSAKPGNCPKCGMKLLKEKPERIRQQQPVQKEIEKNSKANSDSKPMDHMNMQKDTASMKSMNMGDMKMGGMEDMPMAKKVDVGAIKYILNNTPPRTVRYDL